VRRLKEIFFVLIIIALSIVFLETVIRAMYVVKYKSASYFTWGFNNFLHFKNGYHKIDTFAKNYFDDTKAEDIHHGFRTRQFTIKKPRGTYRIVALGGSSVYGTMCPGSFRGPFTYSLEQKLNGGPGGGRYEVINAGIPGQTTHGAYNLLREEIFDMEPDMIILYSLWNHFKIDKPAIFKAGRKADAVFQKALGGLGGKSLLAYFVLSKLGTISFLTTDKVSSYGIILENIIAECAERNVRVMIVKQLIGSRGVFASLEGKNLTNVDKMSTELYGEALRIIDDLQKKYGTLVVDFSSQSPHCKGRLSEFLVDDVHLTKRAYDVLADLIYKELATSGAI